MNRTGDREICSVSRRVGISADVVVCVLAYCHGGLELLLFNIRSRHSKRKELDQAKCHERPSHSCVTKWPV